MHLSVHPYSFIVIAQILNSPLSLKYGHIKTVKVRPCAGKLLLSSYRRFLSQPQLTRDYLFHFLVLWINTEC